MTDSELLELIAAQVGALTSNVDGLTNNVNNLTNNMNNLTKDVAELKEGQNKIESELYSVKRITLGMEQSHGKQLTALFDGYKQNAEKLDRIEKEVSKHEEIILWRVK